MKTIRISRKKWLAGDKAVSAGTLWDPEVGQGCCLGHVIHQTARVSWDQLTGKDMPDDFYRGKTASCLVDVSGNASCGFDVDNSRFSQDAAAINDDSDLSRKQKERKLISLFKKNNLRLVFVP